MREERREGGGGERRKRGWEGEGRDERGGRRVRTMSVREERVREERVKEEKREERERKAMQKINDIGKCEGWKECVHKAH